MAGRPRQIQTAEASPPGRRERNKQEKLARIVEAARVLFSAKGFSETTTQEIAEAADIGTGTLFLYARSKEDLLVLVFKDEMITRAAAAFDAVPHPSPLIDQLMHVFNIMADYHERDMDLSRILLREIMFPANNSRDAEIQTLMREIYRGLADLVIAGQTRGSLQTGANPQLAAENLFGAYYMCLQVWLGGRQSRSALVEDLRLKLALKIDGLT